MAKILFVLISQFPKFGVSYPENSDLPERLKAGVELNQPNPDTFLHRRCRGL